ncbi:MAG: hypothetical protein PWQ39_1594, partial [Thermacetogenium sp.]|nr:hypothetical protein [Thermacetogenium sp.]
RKRFFYGTLRRNFLFRVEVNSAKRGGRSRPLLVVFELAASRILSIRDHEGLVPCRKGEIFVVFYFSAYSAREGVGGGFF